MDRGRCRARAGAQLEARDRGVRPRRVRAPLPRRGRPLVPRADEGLDPARPVDGLGQRLLHLLRHEHRVHLAVPRARARAGLALRRPPLDGVVPALRHLDLGARAARPLRGPHRSRRSTCASRCSTARASGSSSGRRRPGRCPPTSRRPSTPTPTTACSRTATGSPCALFPDETFTQRRQGSRARRPPLPRAVRHARAGRRRSSTVSSRGTMSRSTPARASSTSRPAAAARTSSSRRCTTSPVLTPVDESRPLLPRVRLAARPLDGGGGRADRRRPRRPRPARPRGDDRAQLPVLLALPHAAHLPPLRRLVHRGRRAAAAAARRERDRRVDARLHGQAHGRLAAQHGRLEHLAAPLLRAAAAVLPLRRAGT